MYSVIIVDDEKTIRENLPYAINFEKYGFQVLAAARNGEEALEKVKAYQPDVILLDVFMPVLDGMGFLKKLHETENITIPYVIMLSGYSDFEYARKAIRYGVKAYLSKPLDEKEIYQILSEIKSELDTKTQKNDGDKINFAAKTVLKMYYDGDGDREIYKEYLLMHCIVLNAETVKEIYSTVRGSIEGLVANEKVELLKSRGCILSYLISVGVLADYQYSMSLFGRHVLYQIKKSDIECALLFDKKIFCEKEGTFRNDFDMHLYQMVTEVFWGEKQIVQDMEYFANEYIEQRMENEDGYLARLKNSMIELNDNKLEEAYITMMEDVEKRRPDILFIQEINYRIYYLLMDLLSEYGEEFAEPIIKPFEWRDESIFICFPRWKQLIWEQINTVFSYILNIRTLNNYGLGEKVTSYIRCHFREPLTLTGVADNFYVNSHHLGKCIQKSVGISFKQYLNELRLEEAKKLLRSTDKLIYQIAEEVGFKESRYFVSKFTAETGKSPMEYRKMMLEQDEVENHQL